MEQKEKPKKEEKKTKPKKVKEVIVLKDGEDTIEIPLKTGEILVRKGKFLVKFD